MNQTDDVVDGAFINRDSGNLAGFGKLQNLLPAVLDIQRDHIHTGGDDFLYLDFVKLQRRLDKVALVFLEHALLLDGFDDIFELLLGDRRLVVLSSGQTGHQSGQGTERCREGLKDGHQEANRAADNHRQRIRIVFGIVFGQNLTEDQYNNRHDNRGNCRALVRAEQDGEDDSGKRGRGDIDNVVADENGGNHPLIIFRNTQSPRRLFVAVFLQTLQANLVHTGQGSFGAREKGRKRHQND